MVTTALMVLAVVIPASAASLLVLALDLRAHRRRRPRRWAPSSSRLTAALGVALGVGGFGLISVAGIAGTGHTARAAESSAEQVWVATATATDSQSAVPPVEGLAAAQLPFAPMVVWGSGFDGRGTYTLVAEVPGAADITLLSGQWPAVVGEGARSLALLDPAAIVDAARTHGVLPQNGVLGLELRTSDPQARVHLTLADRPAAPAAAPPLSFTLPPSTAAVAPPAARPPVTAAAAAPAPGAVGVPATGSGAPLLGGLVLVVAGSACAGLSLRLRRGGRRPA